MALSACDAGRVIPFSFTISTFFLRKRPNPSINQDASDKAAGAGYVKRLAFKAAASGPDTARRHH